jgi:hypothetical protein
VYVPLFAADEPDEAEAEELELAEGVLEGTVSDVVPDVVPSSEGEALATEVVVSGLNSRTPAVPSTVAPITMGARRMGSPDQNAKDS